MTTESPKYVIGIDLGTLSGRAVVVDASNGNELGSAVLEYTHAVMDHTLTAGDNQQLPPDFALQDPRDYLEAVSYTHLTLPTSDLV